MLVMMVIDSGRPGGWGGLDGEKGEAFSRGEREKRGRKESLGLNFE